MSRGALPLAENAALTVQAFPLSRAESTIDIDSGQIVMTDIYSAQAPKQAIALAWLKRRATGEVAGADEVFDARSYRALGDTALSGRALDTTENLERMSQDWLRQNGYDPGSVTVRHREARLLRASKHWEPTEDAEIVRPDIRLFGIADGAGGHGDGEKVSRIAADSLGDHVEEPDEAILRRAPRGLDEDRSILWAGVNATERDIRREKLAERLAANALTTLNAGMLGRAGLALVNVADSRAQFVNFTTGISIALSTEQSVGVDNNLLVVALGTEYPQPMPPNGRPYSTKLSVPRFDPEKERYVCEDELLLYEWDELLKPDEEGAFFYYSDGVSGDKEVEQVRTTEVAASAYRYRKNPALGARVIVSQLAQKIDDRRLVRVGVKRLARG